MNWLITGGCGFIGSALIRELVKAGANKIRVVDNLSVGTPDSLAFTEVELVAADGFSDLDWDRSAIQICQSDIRDADAALKIAKGADIIVHLAANTGVPQSVEDPRTDCDTNIFGTFNYLEAARQNNVARFVFASSGAPVGEVEPPIHEEVVPHPVSPYGASKLGGEAYCSVYYHCYGVQTMALRFGNVYGPGSLHKKSVVAKFLNEIINKEPITIYGDGSQTRDFIYIADLIRAIVACSEKENIGGEVFQIATSREVSVNEIAEALLEVVQGFGLSVPEVIYASARKGDVARNYSDTSKAKKYLGWQAEMNLVEGLRETVQYFMDTRAANS
ncbi:NAD-dependent epimerase/dehydratase family protein [Sneathiella chinensis]|uniref:NDP-sugar dehydratase or epimerase n=1 Tax=Sneathiella chinensis TaxID=349750 RepID=A0ABQ5U2X3_9PROT|nr:NAD-dependent epimerase/dehydratase family protein [Sneathiella chinensis]GLQ05766.1 NDP-sugar dehydratase or epimerase [Sneathiella chinensis]